MYIASVDELSRSADLRRFLFNSLGAGDKAFTYTLPQYTSRADSDRCQAH